MHSFRKFAASGGLAFVLAIAMATALVACSNATPPASPQPEHDPTATHETQATFHIVQIPTEGRFSEPVKCWDREKRPMFTVHCLHGTVSANNHPLKQNRAEFLQELEKPLTAPVATAWESCRMETWADGEEATLTCTVRSDAEIRSTYDAATAASLCRVRKDDPSLLDCRFDHQRRNYHEKTDPRPFDLRRRPRWPRLRRQRSRGFGHRTHGHHQRA